MLNDFSDAQQNAIDQVERWYADRDRPIFRLFGFAGTGKTTLAKHLAARHPGKVLFAAYTGKAANVLRSKGCTDASTIHRLIYFPDEHAASLKLRELERQRDAATDQVIVDSLVRQISKLRRHINQTRKWVLRDESLLDDADLLIIDEVSMVDTTMARDLLSFDVPLLVLGDPAQLPPVSSEGGFFTNARPDVLLTEVHRSALDSPVTVLATTIRNSPLGDGSFGCDWFQDGDSGWFRSIDADTLLDFDQVIVGRNATRWVLTHQLRAMKGFGGPDPEVGDRIMFLQNNYDLGVFNGQQAVVEHVAAHRDKKGVLTLTVMEDDAGEPRNIDVWHCGFVDRDGELEAADKGRNSVAAATFAQVITCHKAQGSQWGSVAVIDESSKVSWADDWVARYEKQRSWLYTAVTRAAQRIVVADRVA